MDSTFITTQRIHQKLQPPGLLINFKKIWTFLLFIFISSAALGQGFSTVDFHQAQNDRNGAKTYLIDWVNGALNSTHTDYWEGIGVPQRVVFTGIKPNTANANVNKHSLRFQVLASKGGKHAYDFPISWEQAFKTAEDIGGSVNELQNLFIQQCGDAFSAVAKTACGTLTDGNNDNVTFADFPDLIGDPGKVNGQPATTTEVDDNIDCFESYIKFGQQTVRYGNRQIELRGNQAISDVTVKFIDYMGSSRDYAEYLLEWTSSSDIIMIRFATRLAPGNGRCGYGSGQGAGSINGAPYHVTLIRLDDVNDPSDNAPEPGVSLGSQDNQIMSNAIQIPPPECGLSAGSSGCTNSSTSFTINYTSADAANATVKFYFTVNTAGAKFENTNISAVGNCTTNTVSVVADANGLASINVVPSGANFTQGSFRVGACVTAAGGSTTCEQPSATTIDHATVVGKVDGSTTTLASPAQLNANQANPTAALTAEGTLNGVQDNTLFTSFTWAVPNIGVPNNATTSNLSATSGASITFTPTAGAGGVGFVDGIYAFEVTATSTANGCIGKDTVYILVSSGATCPGITGPDDACENEEGLVFTAGATSPGSYLTYVWSIVGTATIVGADDVNGAGTKSGVDNITVNAGSSDFTVVLSIKSDNGQVFTFEACEHDVDVVPTPTVAAVYNPPACDENTFTVDVVSPVIGYTYSIDQPGNSTDFSSQTKTPTAQDPDVQFTGLLAGDGFIVTVNTNGPGCTATTDCASSTNSCTTESITTRTINTQPSETYRIKLESAQRVNATPNPYLDRVRFNLVSGVTGRGSLELFNMLGQKVAVVFEGHVQAGWEINKDFLVPKAQRSTLIYVFTVGEQKVTGKLIGLR